jgi:hypothetical protein
MKWQTKIEIFLNNTELLQDIKSVLMLAVSIVLPMLYFLYSDNFTLGGLLGWEFGVLALFVVIGNVIVFFESSDKAFRDELTTNEDVVNEETRTKEKQATLPKKIDTIITFNKFYNDEQQHNRNLEFTNEVIRKYENKILKRKIRGKPYDKIEDEIERLRETPLFDKTYKPVEIRHIIAIEKIKKDEMSGNKSVNVNPKTYGFKRFMAKQPIKALSIGGSGMFVLGISDSFFTILTFYVVYLLSLAILFALRYLTTRRVTKTLYVLSLRNIQQYIVEYHEFMNTEIEIDFTGPLDIAPTE